MKKLVFLFFLIIIFFQAGFAESKPDLAMGFQYLNDKQYAKAETSFSNALSSEALLQEYALYGLAQSQYLQANYASAASNFSRFLDDHNDSILLENGGYYLILSYSNANMTDEALSSADEYLKNYPDGKYAAYIAFKKGEILQTEDDFRNAFRAWNEVDLFYPLSSYAKLARINMKSIAEVHRSLKYHPNPKILFAKGEDAFNRNDFDTASAIFNRLAREFPKHKLTAKAFLMLGRAEMEKGSDDSSIKDIEKSYEMSDTTQQGKSLYYLGRANARRGRYERAANIMYKAATRYPRSEYADSALYYLGFYFEKLDMGDSALWAYMTLINNYQKSYFIDDAILKAGRLYYVKGDYKASHDIYGIAKSLRVGSETPQCLFMWGLTAEKLGNIPNASGIYYYLAERFDHTYQGYRALEKLTKLGYATPRMQDDVSRAKGSNEANIEEVMKDWQDSNPQMLDSMEVSNRINKYERLADMGLEDFAYQEVRQLLSKTDDGQKESAQMTLGRVMQRSGEYARPISLVEGGIRSAVLSGSASKIPQEKWMLAYPKGFWDKVQESSKKHGVDPYLALAVIREESRFNPKAVSRSKARGLMQIMYGTGKGLAKSLKIKPFKKSTMFNPETNIEMGTLYLADLIRSFNGNQSLALAGYNGGPNRVRRWFNNWYNGDYDKLDIDEFVQNIPLSETRKYVQKVMGSYYEYKRIYD
ncbi:transglycosylase SLT domain-containing protein [Candidatus Saganbacteria bacterium]|nr:transglycosylase SLT domain-containing protein [Candidatus Saganbacteria bacterium]